MDQTSAGARRRGGGPGGGSPRTGTCRRTGTSRRLLGIALHTSRALFGSVLGTSGALLGIALFLGTALPGRAAAQVTWLDFEDGDILNVSSADGPVAGTPFLQFRRSTERSTMRGTVILTRVRAAYGVTPWLAGGISGVHLQQAYHQYAKRGPGDTNLSLKFHCAPFPRVPLRIGLRQSLSIPTGFERERDGLAPFTSRHNDYSAQLLCQYRNPRFSLVLNPGVLLPGGDADSYVTGGLGVIFRAPAGVEVRSEYYTRWNMVLEQFQSEISGEARSPLFYGLAVQAGVKRRLLEAEQVRSEFHLGLCFGRDWTPEDAYQVRTRQRGTVGLLVHPIETLVCDPHGTALALTQEFRTDRAGPEGGLIVFARTSPAESIAPILETRHYELNVRILEIREAQPEGTEIPSVLRAARARTSISATAELIAPDGYSVLRRAQYEGRAVRVLGASLAPESGSIEQTVVPSEIRDGLRGAAVRDLGRQILEDTIKTVRAREGD